MASVFFADPMSFTPFDPQQRAKNLSAVKLEEASSAEEADVIVGRRLSAVLALFELNKRYYVWTHEPTYAPVGERYILDQATGINVAVSSAFNGDVYLTPLYYFYFQPLDVDDIIGKARRKSDFCSFLATYRVDQAKYIGGMNADLAHFRQSLGLHLQRAGLCKIYGRGWPEHVPVEGESRGTGWHATKLQIIEEYRYNIAVENTIAHNFVTEKHWDALRAGCVQVYFGAGSGVEAVTPSGAYIDCSGGATFDEVAGRLQSLTQDDREDMLALSVRAFNRVFDSWTKPLVVEGMVARFAERVEDLLDSA